MKTHFTLFLAFMLCLQAKAQLSDSINYKPVVIYYNADYQITKKEQAAYARVAYFPEKLKDFKKIESISFDGPIKDYYADGTLWATGNYTKGICKGSWSFYYPNGQLDCRGNFDGTLADGKWEFWWPNGQPLLVAEFKKADMRLLNFWKENGEQTIKDGNGIYTAITTNEEGKQMKLEVAYKDGYQFGRWTYGPVDGEVQYEQTFDYRGHVIEGISYVEKRKKTYTENKFEITPEPSHLVKMSFSNLDTKVYSKSDYPALAELMGCEVQTVDLPKDKNITKTHYYKIIQKHSAGIDTLEYGVPVVKPVFRKDAGAFLSRNLKYPQQLSDANIGGLIVVQFYVKADGSVYHPSILKGLHPLLDQEVLRVFKLMPNWEPATRNGKPFDMLVSFPVRFNRKAFIQEKTGWEVIPDVSSPRRNL